jgi:hypothetical protein
MERDWVWRLRSQRGFEHLLEGRALSKVGEQQQDVLRHWLSDR